MPAPGTSSSQEPAVSVGDGCAIRVISFHIPPMHLSHVEGEQGLENRGEGRNVTRRVGAAVLCSWGDSALFLVVPSACFADVAQHLGRNTLVFGANSRSQRMFSLLVICHFRAWRPKLCHHEEGQTTATRYGRPKWSAKAGSRACLGQFALRRATFSFVLLLPRMCYNGSPW